MSRTTSHPAPGGLLIEGRSASTDDAALRSTVGQPTAGQRPGRLIGRAVLAGATVFALLTVVPLMLVRLTGALPLDLGSLSPAGLLRPDDGALLLLLLATLAWASWAVLAVSVAVELGAALRGAPTPRLPGLAGPQRLAGALVTALLVGVLPLGSASGETAAAPVDLSVAVLAAQTDADDDLLGKLDGRVPGMASTATPADESGEAELATIVTQRHDTLWLLAEQLLGSGERFTEIVALNVGVRQPDGRALRNEGPVYPGWVLRLPADASTDTPRPARHVVQPGDSLWEIAAEELGDPSRYHELAAENRGDLQPDGRRMTDPRLIRPGWVIALPSPADARSEGGSAGSEPGVSSDGAPAQKLPEAGVGSPAPGSGTGGTIDGLDGRGTRSDESSAPDAASDPRKPDSASEPDSVGNPGWVRQPGGSKPGRSEPGESEPGSLPPLDRGSSQPLSSPRRSSTPSSAPASASASDPREEATPAGGSGRGFDGARQPERSTASSATTGSADPRQSAQTTEPDGPSAGPSQDSGYGGAAESPDHTLGGAAETAARPTGSGAPTAAPSGSPGLVADRGEAGSGGDTAVWPGVALPAGGVAAALLLGGLGAELARRRIQFQRWRRAGERLPIPSWRARRLEATFGGGRTDAEMLEHALAVIAAAPEVPNVRIVELGAGDVVLHLADNLPSQLPAPYVAASARSMRATREDLLGVQGHRADLLPLVRALVTVGIRADRTVLVDLAAVGTLHVAGDEELVTEVLRAIATEVALDRRLCTSTRTLCLRDSRIVAATEAGEIIVDSNPDRVRSAVATALRRSEVSGAGPSAAEPPAVAAILLSGAQGDSLVHRPRGGAGASTAPIRSAGHVGLLDPEDGSPEQVWADPFEIVVADRALGIAVPSGSGVGLVTSVESVPRGLTLAVRDAGKAVLLEDAIELSPVGLSHATVADVVELFAATEVPTDPFVVQDSTSTELSERSCEPVRSAPVADSEPDRRGQSSVASGGEPEEPTGASGADVAGTGRAGSHRLENAEAASADRPHAVRIEGSEAPGAAGPRVLPLAGETSDRPAGGGPGGALRADGRAAQHLAGRVDTLAVGRPGHVAFAGGSDVAAQFVASQSALVGGEHADVRLAVGSEDEPDAARRGGEASRVATEAQAPGGSWGENISRPDRPAPPPRLLLLGDVEVENAQGRAESTRIGRLAETAAFMLLHPGTRPSELLAALWPGRHANPQSCRQMISRTRSWLGRTEEGDTYVEPFAHTGGRLRLRPEVRSDWDDFQALADRGLADPDDIETLTAALDLVRGRPFGSLWRREMAWADIDVHRMISRIVDVAHELALRHEAAGRPREARAAIHRAMRTQAESELLDELLERLERS